MEAHDSGGKINVMALWARWLRVVKTLDGAWDVAYRVETKLKRGGGGCRDISEV